MVQRPGARLRARSELAWHGEQARVPELGRQDGHIQVLVARGSRTRCLETAQAADLGSAWSESGVVRRGSGEGPVEFLCDFESSTLGESRSRAKDGRPLYLCPYNLRFLGSHRSWGPGGGNTGWEAWWLLYQGEVSLISILFVWMQMFFSFLRRPTLPSFSPGICMANLLGRITGKSY